MNHVLVKCLLLCVGLVPLGCGTSSTGHSDPPLTSGASGNGSSGAPGAGGRGSTAGQAGSLGAGGAASDLDGFCERLMAVEANFDAVCASDPLSFWSSSIFSAALQCPRLKDAVAAGRVSFDDTTAAACMDAVEKALSSADCNDGSTDAALQMTSSACAGVLSPKVPAGGACKSFNALSFFPECSAGDYCEQGGGAQCVGSCVPYLAAGDACDALNSGVARCGPGLSCANQHCAALAGQNEACGGPDARACDGALYCDGATAAQAGSCKPAKSGGACQSSNECGFTLHCDASGNCTPRKGPGATCTAGAHECGLLNYCNAGKCAAAAPGIGEPCGLIEGENAACGAGFCDTGPFATSGACRARKLPGEACTGTPALGECAGDNARCDAASKTCVACGGQ